ncbi:MAG: hypothetical protein KJZ91_02365 [Myxococcales bacterium]|nr:hypothetical protein [Myxococcales bacterium]
MMRLTSRITVVVGLVVGGAGACKFPELPPIDEDGAPGDGSGGDGTPGDGGDPDAATACVPETETCADGRYTQCDATGNFVQHLIPNGGASGEPFTITMDAYDCPMGCHATAPRCADIDTLNVVNAALDNGVSAVGADIVLPLAGSPDGTIALDTGQFDSVAAEVRITDTGGGTIRIPAEVLTQSPPAPAVLVLKTRTFTLRAGSTLRLDGARALAIASHFDVRIEGVIDGSGQVGVAGQAAGPGSLGGPASCVGQWMSFVSGGAGNVSNGGRSSTGLTGGELHPAGPPALAGGCASSGVAGGGGGIQLASRTRIALASTAQIDVSGGGGTGFTNVALGGGSGGNVLLHAPVVFFGPGAVVAGRGGGGGAGGPSGGASGAEGTLTGTAGAAGGTCSGCGTGGTGGTETSPPTNGTGSTGALGGGGGAAGRCHVRTRTGTPIIPAGTMRLSSSSLVLAPRSP